MLNVEGIRKDFPILHQKNTNGVSLAYLDNAATTQKPLTVINRLTDFYSNDNANIHRGIYSMAIKSTESYENVRFKVQNFLNAKKSSEIIFTSGATESINLVSRSFVLPSLKEGDNILITGMEHHSNLIPWQQIAKESGADLRILPVMDNGELDMEIIDQLIDQRTKMIALVHISNTLGTINPVNQICRIARQHNVPVLIDAAQSAAYYPIDVQEMDCDFLVFSGHKVFGPTGVGVLYAKEEHLTQMPPYQFGGEMIRTVSFEETLFATPPQKFEAGTPNIAGVIGLGAAIDYIQNTGKHLMLPYLQELHKYAEERIRTIKQVRVIGQAKEKSAIISFTIDKVHPHDIATILNEENVAVRAGHHCTEPLMRQFELPGTTRASFSIYNTKKEVDQLINGLRNVVQIFKRR